jgi:hypothetical protein
MNELISNQIIFAAVSVGALLALVWLVRWWHEHQYDLSHKTKQLLNLDACAN